MHFSIVTKNDNGTGKVYYSLTSFQTALSRLIYEYEKAGASVVDVEVYSDVNCIGPNKEGYE